MIELSANGSILAVGLAAVAAVGWASYVSVRSASAGPAWALAHLARTRPVLIAVAVIGSAALVAVDPIWVGVGVLYVVAAVGFLVAMLRRTLARLQAVGGFDEIPMHHRVRIVSRATTALAVLGLALAVVGGVGAAMTAGAIAWVVLALGVTLLAAAMLLGRDAAGE